MQKTYKRRIEINIKKIVSRIVLFFLFKGFKVTYKYDENIKREIDSWEEGFTATIDTGEKNLNLIIKKQNGKLVRLKQVENSDIEIVFKSIDVAFRMFTGRLGVSKAYAEHRFTLKGEIGKAMSLVRCVDTVEAYLFPKFITNKILKTQPHKQMGIIKTYIAAIFN